MGHERLQSSSNEGAENSSAVSTVNSVKSQKTVDSLDNGKFWREYRELKIENMRLVQELLEGQKAYQNLLQQTLDQQRVHLCALGEIVQGLRENSRQESGYFPEFQTYYYYFFLKI